MAFSLRHFTFLLIFHSYILFWLEHDTHYTFSKRHKIDERVRSHSGTKRLHYTTYTHSTEPFRHGAVLLFEIYTDGEHPIVIVGDDPISTKMNTCLCVTILYLCFQESSP